MRTVRLALAQINLTVGDLAGNGDKVLEYAHRAAEAEADIVAFPELTITGYPPEDLVLKPDFIRENRRRLDQVASEMPDITAVVGFVDSNGDIFNAAAVIQEGRVQGIYHKCFLPNYAVFDEQRYFKAGDRPAVYLIRGVRVGLTICEDIWYPVGPATLETMAGAEVIVNINASPFSVGRQRQRCRMIATRAQDELAYVAYVNLIGGQDELVFEGNSAVFDWRGETVAASPGFEEDLLIADLDVDGVFNARLHDTRRRQMRPPPGISSEVTIATTPLSQTKDSDPKPNLAPGRDVTLELCRNEEIYRALVLGTRDYVVKNRFRDVVVGLSGGIDSALTATIAVDALGCEHVIAVSMPSRYSSAGSKSDAAELASNLGIRMLTISIEKPFEGSLSALSETFADTTPDITEENLQARIRGNILMALSNKFGWLVLTTGNKSETAVGFSTLYGDTAGGFGVVKDVYKTTLFRLSNWRNEQSPEAVIPPQIIAKEPSAELREDQRDVDRLPPYDVLDPILEAYIEGDRSVEDIAAQGHDRATVDRVVALVDANEYKRRQGPPGVRISTRAFGKDRRLPITNRFRSGR
ncbi:MAG TPA: NAD+ synthase [Chloroflexota bacterium]|nr:NAD+ synthase [Chloroflexota bacterium]